MFWNDALGQLRIFYQIEGLPFRNVHNTWERLNLQLALTKHSKSADVDVWCWRPSGRRKRLLVPAKSMSTLDGKENEDALNVVYNTLLNRERL